MPPDAASIPGVTFPPGDEGRSNAVSTPFRASTAEEGHTPTEQAIYEMLGKTGTPDNGECRIAAGGNRTLAEQLHLSHSTVKVVIKSLILKLALDIVDDRTATNARTYRVYSYSQIRERRSAAALDWVYPNRQGVFLGPALQT